MAFKDILALAITLDADKPALRAAGVLAAQFDAHATALVLGVHAASIYAPHVAKLSEVLTDLAAGSRGVAGREHAKIVDWLAQAHRGFETRNIIIEDALLRREVLAHARHADLAVLTRAAVEGDRARAELLDAVLFGSGRPTLLVPPAWKRDSLSERIVVGWDAKREAARAVGDAMPLLRLAHEVVVATVDAIPGAGGHGPAPGKDLAAHLARHGVKVRVNNVDGMGRSEGLALLDEAAALDADLVVIGAYGHSRAEEWLLGGVTRELTSSASVPLFLSH
jgi:nucleotide-binding universal stress UspA family protein